MRPVMPKAYHLSGLTMTAVPAATALEAEQEFWSALKRASIAWRELRRALLMVASAIAIARGGRQQERSGSRVVGRDIINTHATALADDLAALRGQESAASATEGGDHR